MSCNVRHMGVQEGLGRGVCVFGQVGASKCSPLAFSHKGKEFLQNIHIVPKHNQPRPIDHNRVLILIALLLSLLADTLFLQQLKVLFDFADNTIVHQGVHLGLCAWQNSACETVSSL